MTAVPVPDTDTWNMTVHLSGPAAFDRIEVRRALEILVERRHCHELRGLPSGRSRLIEGDNLDAAVELAGTLADDRGVYITLNPVRHDLGDHAAKKADIIRRRWMLIDCDPKKSDPDGSSTEAERNSSAELANAVLDNLESRGWPAPLVISSGNGYHLLYRIDLPNDKPTHQLIAGCLKALSEQHDTEAATVDRKVHDANRITKLPGTWARKGPDTPERPHRLASLVNVPDRIEIVPAELIAELASLLAMTPPVIPPKPDPWTMKAGAANGDSSAYAKAALHGEVGKVAGTIHLRNDQLNESACKLGGYVAGGYLDRTEVERQLTIAARAAGLEEGETRRTIKSGLDAGEKTPKVIPELKTKGKDSAEAKPEPPKGALTVCANELDPEDPVWLWEDRIPEGFLTLFAGQTSIGKSFLACHIAACLTTGRPLPGQPLGAGVGGVLIISEDPPNLMLVPRLIEMGADRSLIRFMTWEAMAAFALNDTAYLERACEEFPAGFPRMIIIDPPTNFLGDTDEHRNSEVRAMLMALVRWLVGKSIACILITHVNKQVGNGTEAINRVMGSIAWVTVPRIAHAFVRHPDDPEQCVFACSKTNLSEKPPALAYQIIKTAPKRAKLEWLGEIDMTADEAMSGEKRPTRKVVATEWLTDRFRHQRRWDSTVIRADAAEHGISKNALWDAKMELPIDARKDSRANGEQYWAWVARDGWPPPIEPENGRRPF